MSVDSEMSKDFHCNRVLARDTRIPSRSPENRVYSSYTFEPATGDVWASFWAQGHTGRLQLDEDDPSHSRWVFIGTAWEPDGRALLAGVYQDLRGVGFDSKGFAWTLGLGSDRVFKLDPATNRRAASSRVQGMAKLLGPGGVRSVVAESLTLKHQLLVASRGRRRAPQSHGLGPSPAWPDQPVHQAGAPWQARRCR